MGMDQKVTCAPERLPDWPALARFFAERGYPLTLRMIEGELAFPDEEPKPDWRELRVGTPDGMVTLRREPDGITLVTWGNADAELRRAWNALAWGLAILGGGTVQTPTGPATAEIFARSAELPAALRTT